VSGEVWLELCPAASPDGGCWLPRGHDGGHAWTLTEAHEREGAR
jgi:hypothetical protein